MKTISFRLLDLIADTQAHEVLYGDIGNAFQDKTKEKIYTRVGKELGDRTESIALITHTLCGLMISTEMFRTLFAGFFRTLGFHPTRFDRDMWMRIRDTKEAYNYICTHVDSFEVFVHDTRMWINRIASTFLFKSHGP